MTILKAENISKQYRLGVIGTGTISHDLNRWWHHVRGKEDPYLKIGEENNRSTKGSSDYAWALKDINFEVQQGEVLGIIGKNGAGKSTLLKILSRVTSPTTGEIKTRGRIASLLEVGTGFHPELTGRENIYLNGAILGMTKAEIKAKESEIIAFSGCERYVDTPVKRYSSGMRVRLAFAVAAFLEPDILVIDEVLAVGDAEFQKKAIGKMQDISKSDGRTVLFVSHNMAAVKNLCTRAIVLEHGMTVFEGGVDEAVDFYLKSGNLIVNNVRTFNDVIQKGVFELLEIGLRNANRENEAVIVESEEIVLETILKIEKDSEKYHVTYHLINDEGDALFSFHHLKSEVKLKTGKNHLKTLIPAYFFNPGTFFLKFFLVKDGKRAVWVEDNVISFTIINGSLEIGSYMGKEPGYIKPMFEWENL
ncbi:ABC transporter, ATP-binding protein [Formosa agariphila KMM 3901]|uniref:ABC transporter, ATP-binding protein n=1 Tax=Formosa agariphila (strain DSM 15362 / KCTC 12365 / LMG 23005 / KMM 3901 / M-2Alg 35-1) TaxID=1347342 RepID=T2KMR7_FORAG|nr:ABC transporter ATP-binding protein [Formosa agariphila]CDF80040.1 ABC transporter, ATP-binding protein [Formosa agariphila KMM 3901]